MPLSRKASPVPRALVVASAAAVVALARPAHALQPVTDFLEHAKTYNPQNMASQATAKQRDAEVSVSTGNLLPSFTAQGTYTRNQYEIDSNSLFGGGSISNPMLQQIFSQIPNSVITPQNQWDAYLTLSVPIINVGNWDRRSASKATLAASEADVTNTELNIAKSVLKDYYTLLGDEAVAQSATHNLDVADHNLKLARDRKEAGTVSELDVQRAVADRARAEQQVTAAQLQVVNTRRDLFSLSGLEPEPAQGFPEDDLHEESALQTWMGSARDLPSVRSAASAREAAEKGVDAAKMAWVPSVTGSAQEHFTNATAFLGGHSEVYLLQLTALWKIDLTTGPQVSAQKAAAVAARANEDRARIAAEDAVFRDWQQIHADIETARSARAQVAATRLAASLADDRYKSGVATQLDVLQARQDAFQADVSRIQADADLAYARTVLRVDAGHLDAIEKAR